jgi:hypothetical protein
MDATNRPPEPVGNDLPRSRSEAKQQGVTRYFTGKPCSQGHVAPRWAASFECCECSRVRCHTDSRKNYMAAYQRERRQDPEIREAERIKSRARMAEVYAPLYQNDLAHRGRLRANNREYYQRLKSSDPNKIKEKRKTDYMRSMTKVENRIKNRLRARFHQILSGNTKADRALAVVGCSLESLKLHLEAGFAQGMSWANFGQWHIDHIRPCASFDLSCPNQQRECFHYSNLQPLWAQDNLKKGASLNG